MQKPIIIYILILLLTSVTILVFHYNNSYRCIERYYYNNNKSLFVLLQICVLVLVLSFMHHTRFVVVNIFIMPWMEKTLKFMKR